MCDNSDANERRRFSRITFNASAVLLQNGQYWPVRIIDISLNGILVEEPPGWRVDPEQPFAITIGLDQQSTRISMSLTLMHHEDGRLGFTCREIDLESATHLRSLLVKNSGNPQLINRQLSALIKSS